MSDYHPTSLQYTTAYYTALPSTPPPPQLWTPRPCPRLTAQLPHSPRNQPSNRSKTHFAHTSFSHLNIHLIEMLNLLCPGGRREHTGVPLCHRGRPSPHDYMVPQWCQGARHIEVSGNNSSFLLSFLQSFLPLFKFIQQRFSTRINFV